MVAITNNIGTITEQQRYLPFGEVRTDDFATNNSITQSDFGFTGQRNLADMGLVDYHARFYDGALGRFIQPDTIIQSYANPQRMNRFSYVSNDPIALTDPTGHVGCLGKNWEDGPQCKLKAESQDQYDIKKHPENFARPTKDMENLLAKCSANPSLSGCPQLPTSCPAGQTCYDTNPPAGEYLAGYRYDVIQWDQVDKWQLFFDGVGIIGSFAPAAGFMIGNGPGALVGEGVNVVFQDAGIIYDLSKSNYRGLTWDVVQASGPQLLKNWGKVIPFVGGYMNFVDALATINKATVPVVPIYKPYPSRIVMPPSP